MTPIVETGLVERFRAAVASRLGLAFADEKLPELEAILSVRLNQRSGNAEQYIEAFSRGADPLEVAELAPLLTVSETFFFRHRRQLLTCFEEVVQDGLQHATLGRPIRILSMGCATGEEPYSLAIMVQETFPTLAGRVEIIGADINPVALDRARRAVYTQWSLRETEPTTVDRWFERQGNSYGLDRTIRERVEFVQCNLADERHVLFDQRFDAVLCRNVIMYFTPERTVEAVRRLSCALRPGGLLFLGHAETLRGLDTAFTLRDRDGTFFYQRTGSTGEGRRLFPVPVGIPTMPGEPQSATWIEDIAHSTERVEVLSRERYPAQPVKGVTEHADLSLPLALLREERFDHALGALRQLPGSVALDPEVLVLEAVLLVHRNRLVDAERACCVLLGSPGLRASAHYLLALCSEAQARALRAIQHDQAAIELDPTFSPAMLHLGRLHLALGQRELAAEALARARPLLEREDPHRIALFGAGFGRKSLLALCDAALERALEGRVSHDERK